MCGLDGKLKRIVTSCSALMHFSELCLKICLIVLYLEDEI